MKHDEVSVRTSGYVERVEKCYYSLSKLSQLEGSLIAKGLRLVGTVNGDESVADFAMRTRLSLNVMFPAQFPDALYAEVENKYGYVVRQ